MSKRSSAARAICAAVMGALVIPLAVFAAPTAAADVNNNIKVSLVSLNRVDEKGNPVDPGTQLWTSQLVDLKLKYNAEQANVQPGDSFEVALSERFFINRDGSDQTPVSKPLTYTNSTGQEVHVGECVLKARSFTCTFNDSVQGKVVTDGELTARLVARNVTTSTEANFNLNGEITTAIIPGGNGIKSGGTFREKSTATKGSSTIASYSTGVNWYLFLGGAFLANNFPTGGPVTVIDTLDDSTGSGALLAPEPTEVVLSRATAATSGNYTEVVARANSGAGVDGITMNVAVSEDRKITTIVIDKPGGFSADENFQVQLPTTTADGGFIDQAALYKNRMTVQGTTVDQTAVRQYAETFAATANLRDKFGSFEVTKVADGNGTVVAGQKFDVLVSYELPANLPPLQGWIAPANPTKLTVTVGETIKFPEGFPEGTKVTLTEDTSTANPAPSETLSWGTPVFSSSDSSVMISADETSASFTVLDKIWTPVTLTNKAIGLGTFEVAKLLTGDVSADLGDKEFTFDYECSDDQSGSLKVSANGGPISAGTWFEDGVTCTITEDAESAKVEGYSVAVPQEQTVTIVKESTAKVEFTNTVTKVTSETPDTTPTSSVSSSLSQQKPGLPKAGAEGALSLLGFGAILAVFAGAGVVTRKRLLKNR